jgi:hypothetical protein
MREKGIISFAPYPPIEGSYLTSKLWDRFLPEWRGNARSRRTEKGYLKVMPSLRPMIVAAKTAKLGVASLDDADFVFVKRRVPLRMGKWKLMPPGVK